MQKSLLSLCFSLAAYSACGQGTVSFINTTSTFIRTNATAIGGGVGHTAPGPTNVFVYGLFTAPIGTTNNDLTSGLWTFTGAYATNTSVFSGGRFNGGPNVVTQTGWPAGVTNSFLVAGWSGNLGRYWSNILGQLNGGQFLGGQWTGGWVASGFFGESAISFGEAGGLDSDGNALPAFQLFGSVPNPMGNPLTNGFDLFPTVQGLSITAQPGDLTVIQGADATFSVSAFSLSPLSYQWSFNGGLLQGATTSSLTISSAQPADAGGYSVLVSDGSSLAPSRTATLTVLSPPSISTPPQDQAVFAGSNVTFSVGVAGSAPFTYQWTFNNVNIPGATSANLNLMNVQLSDSGSYAVAITNAAGYAIGGPAELTVMAPPSITNQPVSTTGYWGKSLTLSAGAAGSGPLGYQWYKDGNLITGATNASLVLNDLQLTDGGGYTVVVSNAYGSVTSSTATVIVNPAGVSLGTYAGLTIDGAVGKTYAIQFSTNVVSWVTLTNLTLTEPIELWVDTNINISAPGHPSGSYRVQAVP